MFILLLIFKLLLSSYLNWRFRDANISYNNNNNNKVDLSDVPESFETFNCVRICCHPIRSKCIQKKHFSCPADRCPRNSSIPIIACLYENDSELQINDENFHIEECHDVDDYLDFVDSFNLILFCFAVFEYK